MQRPPVFLALLCWGLLSTRLRQLQHSGKSAGDGHVASRSPQKVAVLKRQQSCTTQAIQGTKGAALCLQQQQQQQGRACTCCLDKRCIRQ